jgi:hypothetical protein
VNCESRINKNIPLKGEVKMGATFTRDQLEAKTVPELRRMCVDELGIPGLTKKPKAVIINAIMEKYGRKTASATVAKDSGKMTGVEWQARSVLTKPDAPAGGKTTTTIHVSCGASSGNFPVAGRTVTEVGEFLREVLNVDRLSTGLVNGKDVKADYVLKPGDNLEFLKPAGKKG